MGRVIIGRALVATGYVLVAIGAVLPPVAFAIDLLGTLPAIAIALVVIAAGIVCVLSADRFLAADGESPPQADGKARS